MIVTASTIGYGDITPISLLARLVVLAILLCVFVVFGDNVSKLGAILKETNFYNRYYKVKDHLVLFGSL